MNILFLARALGPGGAERQMALLAAGLQRRGHDVTVATFYPGGNFRAVVTEAGALHISLDKRGRWEVIGFLARLRRLLKERRPQIVYSFLPPANILAALVARAAGRPRVVWGIRVSDMDLGPYDWVQKLAYWNEARLSPSADLLVFNSESGIEGARRRGLATERAVVIANGIDTKAFAPDATARRRLRDAWGVRENETVIGMIGRFDPMKDHATFLRAAGRLALSRPDLRLVLAGVGTAAGNPRLDDLLRSTGCAARTILLGERPDMPAVMAALDILCLSSAFGEGFPNVLGEAMAAGVPCVATDVGDARHVVGETGEIVPPGDAEALARAMDRLLDRLARSPDAVRGAARDRIVARFSLDRMVDRSESALAQLLGARAAPVAADRISTIGN